MTTRCPSCSQTGAERSNPQGEARCGELVSRNTSELDSASLRNVGVAKLPEMLKPETIGEATPMSNRWAPRGGWRWRARKEKSRNLRDPIVVVSSWSEVGRSHSSGEGPNPPGAKGADCKHATKEIDATA
jgi:hypothetical protein